MTDADFHTRKISECLALAEQARDAAELAVYLAMADEFAQKAGLSAERVVTHLADPAPLRSAGIRNCLEPNARRSGPDLLVLVPR